jgi:hypothetical protein
MHRVDFDNDMSAIDCPPGGIVCREISSIKQMQVMPIAHYSSAAGRLDATHPRSSSARVVCDNTLMHSADRVCVQGRD